VWQPAVWPPAEMDVEEISLRPLSLRPGGATSNPFASFGKGAGFGIRNKTVGRACHDKRAGSMRHPCG